MYLLTHKFSLGHIQIISYVYLYYYVFYILVYVYIVVYISIFLCIFIFLCISVFFMYVYIYYVYWYICRYLHIYSFYVSPVPSNGRSENKIYFIFHLFHYFIIIHELVSLRGPTGIINY